MLGQESEAPMLVYGDVERRLDAARLKKKILDALAAAAGCDPGLPRHATLIDSFLGAAALIGGLLDRDMREQSVDQDDEEGMTALLALARAVDRSWQSLATASMSTLYFKCGSPETQLSISALLAAATNRLSTLDVGVGVVAVKPVEGHAFYALYPESYAEAARRSGLPATTRVIGIRSAGTALAATIAAALGADVPVTVRPVGHPFDRKLQLSAALERRMFAGDPPCFAVVDEGPGLSGSSFGAAADWLAARGVAPGRIHFFPSHAGEPGGKATSERLHRWRAAPKHHLPFEALFVEGGMLAGWVADLIGPLDAPLRDISGGKWRALKTGLTAEAPAAGQWERLKFLAMRGHERWLVKFAGLGGEGDRKLEMSRRLHAAGFGPEPAGLRHGFLVERWIHAPGLPDAALPRRLLVAQLGDYLAFRASLAAPSDGGALLVKLAEMAVQNAVEALGDEFAEPLRERLHGAEDLERHVRRVDIDARLHRWEWLVIDGRLLKTDGLDHSQAHDFIGAQDIAWDLAGAIVEHDLDKSETEQLIAALERHTGRVPDRRLLVFLLPCYVAFQLGAWTMALGADVPIVRRYGTKLAKLAGARLATA
jgi:hypothetical protein